MSRMRRKAHVRFLGKQGLVTVLAYPTISAIAAEAAAKTADSVRKYRIRNLILGGVGSRVEAVKGQICV